MSDEIILTESSYDKLRRDLEIMKSVERGKIAEELRKARAFGDLSENFEYHAARNAQGFLNAKIADIERTLEVAVVVPDSALKSDEVGLGAIVMVHDMEEDDEFEYFIVDQVQADPANDRISIESPLADALKGHKVGDIVEANVPAGLLRFEILSIRHE